MFFIEHCPRDIEQGLGTYGSYMPREAPSFCTSIFFHIFQTVQEVGRPKIVETALTYVVLSIKDSHIFILLVGLYAKLEGVSVGNRTA